jgi:hypothetical protein
MSFESIDTFSTPPALYGYPVDLSGASMPSAGYMPMYGDRQTSSYRQIGSTNTGFDLHPSHYSGYDGYGYKDNAFGRSAVGSSDWNEHGIYSAHTMSPFTSSSFSGCNTCAGCGCPMDSPY